MRNASKKIGNKAEEIAVHVKGLDIPGHDPRAYFSMALTYVTSTRGACHLHGFSEFAEMAQGAILIPEVGISEALDRYTWEGKAYVVARYQDWFTVMNSLVQCMMMPAGGMTLTHQAEILSAVTGWKVTPIELMQIGERIFNLQRAFNVRLGISRKDNALPKRVVEPLATGGAAGKVPPLEPLLNEYYQIRGWDSDGRLKAEKMVELGLSPTEVWNEEKKIET